MSVFDRMKQYFRCSFQVPEEDSSGQRYVQLRRNILLLMLAVTLIPLTIMAGINYLQYRNSLRGEKIAQIQALSNKAKHSMELFLQERMSAIRYIVHAYDFEQLNNKQKLSEIFYSIQQSFSGFVDLGVIDTQGHQVNYVGPYDLLGKDYSDHHAYQEVRIKGSYISDVFLGYRRFPHFVMAVEHRSNSGKSWVVRSSIDIENLNDIIASMGLGPKSDAFLLNRNGVLQTPSKYYGDVLDEWPMPMPPQSFQPTTQRMSDSRGRQIFLTYVYFPKQEYVLAVASPTGNLLQSWYALQGQMVIVFVVSVVTIVLVIFKLADVTVKRIKQADEKREAAFRELEHTHKLSSIGRMAAGVAHEVNNPLAIINEKSGLLQDLVNSMPDFPKREKFISIADSIVKSVERARGITYRLLGFARRLEAQYDLLDINQVVREVLGFLEKEAEDKNVQIALDLDENLTKISSDQGQLEQVFLNILTNALAAVEDGGRVTVSTREDGNYLNVTIQDNGCGMSKTTLNHIFEPFFTTKKGYGTGLGLSITYGIVKKLGGDIHVESHPGVGTTFSILLPK